MHTSRKRLSPSFKILHVCFFSHEAPLPSSGIIVIFVSLLITFFYGKETLGIEIFYSHLYISCKTHKVFWTMGMLNKYSLMPIEIHPQTLIL